MTPPLRRAHRIIWLVLAITLPIGFVAALRAVQPPLLQGPIAAELPAQLPVLVRSFATDSLVITLRRATQGTEKQLDIVVKHPFEVSSAVVRVRQSGGWRAVGLIDAPGTYRFPLPNADNQPQIEIVDDVHARTLLLIQW